MISTNHHKHLIWLCYLYAFVYTILIQGFGYRIETWKTMRRFYFKELDKVFTIKILLRPIVYLIDLYTRVIRLDSATVSSLSPSRVIMRTFFEIMVWAAFGYAILDQIISFTFESYVDRGFRLMLTMGVMSLSRSAISLWDIGEGVLADTLWHCFIILPYVVWRTLDLPKQLLWVLAIFAQHGVSYLLIQLQGTNISLIGSALVHIVIALYTYAFLKY